MATYLSFNRQPGDVSVRTARPAPGLLVDYTADGRPIGVEVTEPSRVSLEAIQGLLAALGHGSDMLERPEFRTPSTFAFIVVVSGIGDPAVVIANSLLTAGCGDASAHVIGPRLAFFEFNRAAGSLGEAINSAVTDVERAGFAVTMIIVSSR